MSVKTGFKIAGISLAVIILLVILISGSILGFLYMKKSKTSKLVFISKKWNLPHLDVRLSQVANVSSHNAFTSLSNKYIIRQQNLSIPQQLAIGVRGIQLDIRKCQDEIVLAHGSCEEDALQRHLNSKFQLLVTELDNIAAFLEANPTEIVHVFYENYINTEDKPLLEYVIENSKIAKFVLTHEYTKNGGGNAEKLNLYKHDPKIIDIVDSGKRCIFYSPRTNKYFWNEWQIMKQNEYSTIDKELVCQHRAESKSKEEKYPDRKMSMFNYFVGQDPEYEAPVFQAITYIVNLNKNHSDINMFTPEILKCFTGKFPNFVNLDFVESGNAFDLVNDHNKALFELEQ